MPGIVSLASEAKKVQRRDDIDKAADTSWDEMARQAAEQLAVNARVIS